MAENTQQHSHDGGHSHGHGHSHSHSHGGHGHSLPSGFSEHPDGVLYDAEDNVTDEEAARLEMEHFNDVVRALRLYRACAQPRITRMTACYGGLSAEHRARVSSFASAAIAMEKAADVNQAFLNEVVGEIELFSDNPNLTPAVGGGGGAGPWGENWRSVKPSDVDKVHTTLRQLVRDWGVEGAAERECCYGPVIAAVRELFPSPVLPDGRRVTVVVPGAGLGRLAWEFARYGYASQGNEFSYFMLLTSNFVLNNCPEESMFTIQPYIHQLSNHLSRADQFREVSIPDISPHNLPDNAEFSMMAGDFLEVYEEEPSSVDAVASCFFLDTAKNIVAYIERIWDVLRPGGALVNLGPLLWHFADSPDSISIELTWEEVRDLLVGQGFEITVEERKESTYVHNIKSMMKLSYNCIFFVAVKPAEA